MYFIVKKIKKPPIKDIAIGKPTSAINENASFTGYTLI
jgi:hypothetical protein